jgi:hypothetical protein
LAWSWRGVSPFTLEVGFSVSPILRGFSRRFDAGSGGDGWGVAAFVTHGKLPMLAYPALVTAGSSIRFFDRRRGGRLQMFVAHLLQDPLLLAPAIGPVTARWPSFGSAISWVATA